ncbi:MAG: PIG-L deacetylase family protein [Candidatus Neomarinimicrobiota bacterium]|jgi:LmbE family N-acetylglucosaminyl deacetylase
MKKILILAPHTDDGEFGCGGTIDRFINEKNEVYYVAFSDCEKSLDVGMPPDTLLKELKNATKTLGIQPENVITKNFEVRCFERDRQRILEEMVYLNKELNPDLVFLPSPNDLHQDHNTIAMEGLRAFKLKSTILGYEVPWNNLTFNTTCFVSLSKENIDQKIRALKCYKSQKNRFYSSEKFIRSLAITRGTQVGVEYAETFEVLRWII